MNSKPDFVLYSHYNDNKDNDYSMFQKYKEIFQKDKNLKVSNSNLISFVINVLQLPLNPEIFGIVKQFKKDCAYLKTLLTNLKCRKNYNNKSALHRSIEVRSIIPKTTCNKVESIASQTMCTEAKASKAVQKNNEAKQGMLILYYDLGLRKMLEKIRPILYLNETENLTKYSEQLDEIKKQIEERILKLTDEIDEIACALLIQKQLQKIIIDNGLSNNIKVLTSLDLVEIFAQMSDVQELRNFLIGEKGEFRYDAPKIVDAIIRLRLFDSGIPVFRLDSDVLFSPKNVDRNKHLKQLQNAICGQLQAIKEHGSNARIYSTILSASYTPDSEKNNLQTLDQMTTAYATRVSPIFKFTANTYADLNSSNLNDDELAERCFDKDIAKLFFNNNFLRQWAAPTTAVISGALLYMSDGVVLDLPPFSNLSMNVMWIDDHLRYALHRELGNFSSETRKDGYGHDLTTQNKKNAVKKYRGGHKNFIIYTLATYMPSLLWGSIYDAWISENTIVKLRYAELNSDEEKKEWKNCKKKAGINRGILTHKIKQIQSGRELNNVASLREELLESAIIRIKNMKKAFEEKKSELEDTLGYQWITGNVDNRIQRFIDNKIKNKNATEKRTIIELSKGIPWDNTTSEPIISNNSLLGKNLNRLITEAIHYLRWVEKWPNVVQVIRSVDRPITLDVAVY